jgi:hypothetical protein
VTIRRLDRVSIFGDKLSFLVPHEWVEDTDEAQDVYLYHAPGADSGWLRVSLITAKDSSMKTRAHLGERAQQENGELYQSDRNLIAKWEKPSQEDGVPIYQYWWAVLGSLGPELSREALFSYTILLNRRDNAETQDDVCILSDLFCNAEFSDPADSTIVN